MRILAHYALGEAQLAHLEQISASMAGCFSAGGYRRIALPVLQPADLYLDMAGEEVRERMFVFEDPSGAELCLRADLTIPVCRSFLDDPSAGLPARLACIGPVFRFEADNEDEPTELIQAGIECLGAPDTLGAEIEVLGLAREAIAAGGARTVTVEIGDVSLFPALVSDLQLEDLWARRLNYAFRHPSLLLPTLAASRQGGAPSRPQPASLSVTSLEAAERIVLERNGGRDEPIARRSVAEIAERLLDKATAAALAPPNPDALAAIEEFVTVSGPAAAALSDLRRLGSKHGVFAAACDRLERHLAVVQSKSASGDEIVFSSVLGRSFVYYTGFVFNLKIAGLAEPAAAGGRYDRLMSDLGSPRPIAAVGCAVWPERVLVAEGGRG